MLRIPGAPAPGARSDAVAETVDVFPTLCDLAGVPPPAGLDGRSLRPQLDDPDVGGRPAIADKTGAETIRTERWRLVRHTRDGTTTHVELYDHASPAGETVNVAADEPEVVAELLQALAARLRDG